MCIRVWPNNLVTSGIAKDGRHSSHSNLTKYINVVVELKLLSMAKPTELDGMSCSQLWTLKKSNVTVLRIVG